MHDMPQAPSKRYRNGSSSFAAAGLAAITLITSGCSDAPKLTQTTTTLSPQDFVKPGAPAQSTTQRSQSTEAVGVGETRQTPADAPISYNTDYNAQAAPDRAPDITTQAITNEAASAVQTYAIDGMVGQVHNQNIYASQIFNDIGEQSLLTRGKQLPRSEFRSQIGRQIFEHLNGRVINELILQEAAKDLTEQQMLGIQGGLGRERERIIRQYGGTLWETEQGLMRDMGLTIEQWLEQRRRDFLVSRWGQEKFVKRVNVSRREVERYYQDHLDQYVQPTQVTGRVIIVRTPQQADIVEQQLNSGTPFATVATNQSVFFASAGGLMAPFESGKAPLRWEELNEAFTETAVGESSPRIALENGQLFGWVHVDKREGGVERKLGEVFLAIETTIRANELSALQRQETERLMQSGNYTNLTTMTNALVEIAMARYATPQRETTQR